MEKGDTRINVRNESLSHVALNELNRPVLPATSGSLKIALLIAGLAAILALVLGLSIGLTHKGKDKKFTRVNIIQHLMTPGMNLIKKLINLFLNSIQQKELIFCLEQKI